MIDRKLIVALGGGATIVALAASLGNWQTERGDAKQAMQANWQAAQRAEPRPLSAANVESVAAKLPQRVTATGRFVADGTVFLDNRIVNGITGVYVVTPLAIESGGPWILVNRGWMPRTAADRAQLPSAPLPDGMVTITGLAVERAPRLLDLGQAPQLHLPGVWQNLGFDDYERVSGKRVARLVVQQTNDTGDGLRRTWPAPASADKHRGYALQWYGLAALAGLLTMTFGGRAVINAVVNDRARHRQ